MCKTEVEAVFGSEELRRTLRVEESSYYDFSSARLITSKTVHALEGDRHGICPECRCRSFKYHVYKTEQGRLHQVKCRECEDSYVCFFPSTYFLKEFTPFDVYDVVGLWQDYDPDIENLAKKMLDTFLPLCQENQIKSIWLGKYNKKRDEDYERWI